MSHEKHIKRLFKQYFAEPATSLQPIAAAGSTRQYCRLSSHKHTAIAAYHNNAAENRAFVEMSLHFAHKNLATPQIYAHDLPNGVYLQQDLGNETLLGRISHIRSNTSDPNAAEKLIIDHYETSIDQLLRLQIQGHEGLDYETLCVARTQFDRQALLWDMQYFKYCFLKLTQTVFSDVRLEADFDRLADFLANPNHRYFMLRDCQARNIMWHNELPYFIDYQGGMQGHSTYDLASLLFQTRANLPDTTRRHLLAYYTRQLALLLPAAPSPAYIESQFYAYVLARTLQVLGAYGLRGLYERQSLFLQSIPVAVDNLYQILYAKTPLLPFALPELSRIAQALYDTYHLQPIIYNHAATHSVNTKSTQVQLSVHVSSFSYRQGVPLDTTGHGIGFVFDCRSIHNPGRYEPYQQLTGKDQPVIDFLETQTTVAEYLQHVWALLGKAVENYMARGLEHLNVNFGCTGGQHRSVYCAEATAQWLQQRYDVQVRLAHTNSNNWPPFRLRSM